MNQAATTLTLTAYLLAKLRFITANSVRSSDGIKRFLALGLPTPLTSAA